MFGKPPEEVPDNLAANQYFELGRWYIEESMMSQARLSLNKCLSLEKPGTVLARNSQSMLRSIPKFEASAETIKRLRKAESISFLNPEKAVQLLGKISTEFPEYEAAYGTMARVQLLRGDIENCYKSLEKCFELNSDYVPAQATKARALMADMEYGKARKYIRQVLSAETAGENEQEMRLLQQALETLASFE